MERILTGEDIQEFYAWLKAEEKSQNTIEKYARDVATFIKFLGKDNITKEKVIEYKSKLITDDYAVRSINSMLASINSLFAFLGWHELKVKSIKLQRQIYCPEEKELTKAEYLRLVNTAKQKGNERLCLLIQTICSTGIRVSELPYITVEAVRHGAAVVSLKGKTRHLFARTFYGIEKDTTKLADILGHSNINISRICQRANSSKIWQQLQLEHI